MPGLPKLGRPTLVARVRRVDVFIHWSVFVIGAVVLLSNLRKPLVALIGLAAYLSVLVVHEAGHLIMARRRGYDPLSIELYPIFGLARFERPDSRFDRVAIAWGGVAAQAIVGVPFVLYVVVFGYSPFEALNAALAILGGLSLLLAAFNLLPFRPLDGSVAWDIVPAFFERRRMRRNRRVVPYRSSR